MFAPINDDSIENRRGIDTTKSSCIETAINISCTYSGDELQEWQPAAVVPNAVRPGEMGTLSPMKDDSSFQSDQNIN